MKVYKGSTISKNDYKKVPLIIIRNEKLKRSGFDIGINYNIVYLQGKIIMEAISSNNIKSI